LVSWADFLIVCCSWVYNNTLLYILWDPINIFVYNLLSEVKQQEVLIFVYIHDWNRYINGRLQAFVFYTDMTLMLEVFCNIVRVINVMFLNMVKIKFVREHFVPRWYLGITGGLPYLHVICSKTYRHYRKPRIILNALYTVI